MDYFNQISTANKTLNDGVVYDINGPVNPTPASPGTWHSWGRKQPYVGFTTPIVPGVSVGNWVPQTPPVAAPPPPNKGQPPPQNNSTQPQHTFFRHNGINTTYSPVQNDTLTTPFFWPVHLDRQLVNPLELMNVSCYGPWEYNQKFGSPTGDHRAPWDQERTLLYRLLEMTQTPYYVSPTAGVQGGRVTGKININTVWNQEIFDALVDTPNLDIGILTQNILNSRSPGVFGSGVVGPTDDIDFAADGVVQPGGQPATLANMNKPFKSLNVGVYDPITGSQYPNGLGMENTILRSLNPAANPKKRLFGQVDKLTTYPPLLNDGVSTGNFPFKTNEILSKIYNNTTTRSNVFAVWLTVGFFEVVDETVYPVKLGAEIGRGENRHVRHRMFPRLIDRTNLMMPDPKLNNNFQMKTTTAAKPGAGVPVKLNQLSWALNNPGQVKVNFNIRPGMVLDFDTTNANAREPVTVLTVDYNQGQITANFKNPHAPGVTVAAQFTPVILPPLQPGQALTSLYPGPNSPVFQVGTPGNVPGSIFGNPGPQEGYFDPRQNAQVVPYFSIIK